MLNGWVGANKNWKLIYKATRDGFGANDFHRTCNGKGENLGVIKSANGFLFGWWTPLSWQSTDDWAADASLSTFIFTLTNPAGVAAKYKLKSSSSAYAICRFGPSGPVLGRGNDIYVPHQSNVTDGFTHIFSYEDTTGRGDMTFTGRKNFKVSQLEVFVPI